MRLEKTQFYLKQENKFLSKHKDLANQYKKTLAFLSSNYEHPSLRLHKITAVNPPFYSVSINMSYRIAIDLMIEDDVIILLNVGNHIEIYNKK